MELERDKRMNKFLTIFKKNAPALLTGVAVVGVVTTAIMSSIDHERYKKIVKEEKPITTTEKVGCAVKAYWPTLATSGVTITSMIFSHKISAKNIATYMALAVAAEERLKKFKKGLEEKLGKEETKELYNDILYSTEEAFSADEECDDSQYRFCLIDPVTHEPRFFISTTEYIKDAFYELNKSLGVVGFATMADLYFYLKWKWNEKDEKIGWSDCVFLEDYGMPPWVNYDFEWRTDDQGNKYRMITFEIEPAVEAMDRVW